MDYGDKTGFNMINERNELRLAFVEVLKRVMLEIMYSRLLELRFLKRGTQTTQTHK